MTRVLGVVTRALSTTAKRRAGLRAGADAETGVVTFIQRFGLALSLNIHLHLLALDGAYTFAAGRAGALAVDPDEKGASPYLNLERPDDDALAVLESASVRCRIAVGPNGGRKTLRLQAPGAVGTATQDRRRRAPRRC